MFHVNDFSFITSREMNETFTVRTLFDCDKIEFYKGSYERDPIWLQSVYGCKLLQILRDMYGFNITYVIPKTQFSTEDERGLSIYPQNNQSFDIYAKPIGLTSRVLENGYPIASIFTWRYGFILKRPYTSVLRKFYTLPFTRLVWDYLYLMILLGSCVFFYLSRWERRMTGGYSSYHYELLLAVGACCQHILPLQANIYSRRIAYLSFILFTYVLHSFYTSNLLSHLVSDKDNSMDLETLAASDYKYAKLENLFIPAEQQIHKMLRHDTNLSTMQNKLASAKYLNIKDGLHEVMTTKTALLSDYVIIYPVLVKQFPSDVICQLIEIDLYSDIKKYLYTSKTFIYKEEFKIGILRAKETGVLQRLFYDNVPAFLNCGLTYPTSAEFEQIVLPIVILLGCYVVSTIIMLAERWHYQRYNVFHYTE